MKPCLSLALAASLAATATPALALPEKGKVNPELAAGLPLVAPLVYTALFLPVVTNPNASLPLPTSIALGLGLAATFGSGHFYQGDWRKGSLFAAGAPLVVVGGGLAASAVGLNVFPRAPGDTTLLGQNFGLSVGASLLVAAGIIGGYMGWAAWDAYHTAEEANRAEPLAP